MSDFDRDVIAGARQTIRVFLKLQIYNKRVQVGDLFLQYCLLK